MTPLVFWVVPDDADPAFIQQFRETVEGALRLSGCGVTVATTPRLEMMEVAERRIRVALTDRPFAVLVLSRTVFRWDLVDAEASMTLYEAEERESLLHLVARVVLNPSDA